MFARRKDGNHKQIASALRQIPGLSVYDINGTIDMCVGYRGHNYLLEVKDKGGTLTDSQVKFFQTWQGNCFIVRSLDDALTCIGIKNG